MAIAEQQKRASGVWPAALNGLTLQNQSLTFSQRSPTGLARHPSAIEPVQSAESSGAIAGDRNTESILAHSPCALSSSQQR